MSTLLVCPLFTSLSQRITIPEPKRNHVVAVRPRLLLFNNPSGSLKLAVKTTAGSELFSLTQSISDIYTNSLVGNAYAHGFFRFQFSNVSILEPGDYDIELSGSSYTYSNSAYIGWLSDYEFVTTKTSNSAITNPLGMEIWTWRDTMSGQRVLDFADAQSSASVPTSGTVTGSQSSATAIVAATGVTHNNVGNEIIFIAGSGGAVDVTADPQIEAGDNDGDRLMLIGTSDTNTVTLEDGTGLALKGSIVLGADDILELVWSADDSLWYETNRNN